MGIVDVFQERSQFALAQISEIVFLSSYEPGSSEMFNTDIESVAEANY